ncbi:MAG: LPXTG cell wall anchor domain-containing protein, partial [Butyrivibrio sp.]|nr:LPXTG cell wall anchor domain-containing protein [Butyrivibrio sp.]
LIEVQRIEDANGTVQISSTISGKKTEGSQIKVENNTGALLPRTGGIGTTIFYLIGGIMILGAFVTFIVKRKITANK